MKLSDLNDLFLHELKDLYDAEHQLLKALPKMAKAATSTELSQAFENHLAETEEHVSRLESVFEACGETPERETCVGMKGLIAEGEKLLKSGAEPEVLDAGLISAAQRVEHYEIAAYGTLIAWAGSAGMDVADLLETTLSEEKAADEKLSNIAEAEVNVVAETADDEESDVRERSASSPRSGTSRSASRAQPRQRRRTRSSRTRT